MSRTRGPAQAQETGRVAPASSLRQSQTMAPRFPSIGASPHSWGQPGLVHCVFGHFHPSKLSCVFFQCPETRSLCRTEPLFEAAIVQWVVIAHHPAARTADRGQGSQKVRERAMWMVGFSPPPRHHCAEGGKGWGGGPAAREEF